MDKEKVHVHFYRWGGSFGPFKIKIPCGECSLTKDIISDTLDNELKDIPVAVETEDWLNVWWRPLLKGAWHAPIVLVEGEVISQGHALNRGVLTEKIIKAHARKTPLKGNHFFGKEGCPYCQRAKKYLKEANINYAYHDVVKDPKALYGMLAWVKPHIPSKKPITVPQVWIDGEYIGGASQLSEILKLNVEPNPERGQCSLSANK